MSRSLKAYLAATLAAILAASLVACGGGSSGSGTAGTGSSSTATLLPTGYTSEGRTYNTCTLSPGCSGNPYAPFSASVSMAPANGATVSGIVRIEVRGYDMQNVELLSASGYTPRYGVFNITGDRVIAWLDLDTTKLPNGPLSVRVSAFNVPAGQPGAAEIVAMPTRTWTVNNAAPPSSGFAAAVTAAPADNSAVSGIVHLEVHGSGLGNVELLPANGYTPRLGVFNVSSDRSTATLDFDTRSLPDGLTNVRISAYNVQEGQPGATEIVAMPPRRWNVSNGNSSANPFTATVTIAPVSGELVSGRVRLEVRGSGIRNVELLPPSGYTPRYGSFNVDFGGTFAWLELDTTTLPNGPFSARISAFDVAAGQPNAREIIAMPTRQWNVQH